MKVLPKLSRIKPLEICPQCMNVTRICKTPGWRPNSIQWSDAVGLMALSVALGALIGHLITKN